MKTSPAGIALIKHFEGCKLEAYRDGGGILTIGYGHTGAGVWPGQKIDQARADQLLAADLVSSECAVSGEVHEVLTQGEFDALVSFAYNCKGWRTSTLILKVNRGDFAGAAREFPRWVHDAKDEVEPGLVKRRAAEQALFNGTTPLLTS